MIISSLNVAGKRACNVFDEFNLTQCITSPTRYSADGTSCSVLDLFATNRRGLVQTINIGDPISRTTVGSKSRSALTPWQQNVEISGMSFT